MNKRTLNPEEDMAFGGLVKISKEGTICIPKMVRNKFHWDPGDHLIVTFPVGGSGNVILRKQVDK